MAAPAALRSAEALGRIGVERHVECEEPFGRLPLRSARREAQEPFAKLLARPRTAALGRAFARAADVGDEQRAAGGEQDVEKDVSVVAPAVAVPASGRMRHEVELLPVRAARKCAVLVEAHDGDDLVGQGPELGHPREGDARSGHAAAGRSLKRERKALHEELEGHLGHARALDLLAKSGRRIADAVEGPAFVVAKEHGGRVGEPRRPASRVRRLFRAQPEAFERSGEAAQGVKKPGSSPTPFQPSSSVPRTGSVPKSGSRASAGSTNPITRLSTARESVMSLTLA